MTAFGGFLIVKYAPHPIQTVGRAAEFRTQLARRLNDDLSNHGLAARSVVHVALQIARSRHLFDFRVLQNSACPLFANIQWAGKILPRGTSGVSNPELL